jgi:tRNA-dihydrouridine synthase A
MLGRAACENPYLFAEADQLFFASARPVPSRREIIEGMLPYIEQELAKGIYLSRLTRPMLNLIIARPGAKAWRRYLSEHAHQPGAGTKTLLEAMKLLPSVVLDERPLAKTLT